MVIHIAYKTKFWKYTKYAIQQRTMALRIMQNSVAKNEQCHNVSSQ